MLVIKRLAVFFPEPITETSRKEAHCELSTLMMRIVSPVLLDVHFIRIQCCQVYPCFFVFVHEVMQEWGCVGREVVHFRRLVLKNDQDPVVSFQLFRPVVEYPELSYWKVHVVRGILDSE